MVLPGWVSQLLVGCMVNACVESTQKGTLTEDEACLQHSPSLVAAAHQLLLCFTLPPFVVLTGAGRRNSPWALRKRASGWRPRSSTICETRGSKRRRGVTPGVRGGGRVMAFPPWQWPGGYHHDAKQNTKMRTLQNT